MCTKRVSSSPTLIVIFFLSFMNLASLFADCRPKELSMEIRLEKYWIAEYEHTSLLTDCLPIELPMETRFEKWIAEYERNYKDDAEKARRFIIFKANAELIDSTNAIKDLGYTVGLNDFSDLTDEEFEPYYNGALNDDEVEEESFRYANMTDVPTNVDWRNNGAVTPIKDQGRCGSSWAFSALAAMEGLIKLKTGILTSLSAQMLVDCNIHRNRGCRGGFITTAFKYVTFWSIASEANYTYIGSQGKCNYDKVLEATVSIESYEGVPRNNETALKLAVANQPVSVKIDGSSYNFKSYNGGIFRDWCGKKTTHFATLVGYGTDDNGIDYWLLKNSWGSSWGEKGYMRLRRNVEDDEGLCGVATSPVYPNILS